MSTEVTANLWPDGEAVNTIEIQDELHENCGVYGAFLEPAAAQHTDLRLVIYNGLQALQHRGQEAAGIAASNTNSIEVVKGTGRVPKALNEGRKVLKLPPHPQVAIGHVRYGTTKSKDKKGSKDRANPILKNSEFGEIALSHNGQINNTHQLRKEYGLSLGAEISDSDTATEVIRIEFERANGDIEKALATAVPKFSGAYALLVMTKDQLFGISDPNGMRPLELAYIANGGWMLSSETCALNMGLAQHARSVTAGEMVVIDQYGVRSRNLFPASEILARRCLLEAVYFARPDSTTDYYPEGDETTKQRSFHAIRSEMGRLLANQRPTEADIVIAVPESGRPAAEGFAEASGLPLKTGIVKNEFVGRSFMQPSQEMRISAVNLKLNPIPDTLYNERVVVVDDSIVRGTTFRRLVQQLRIAGAKEVHLRISSPPIKWPCFYGIDIPASDELLASDMDVEEMRLKLGADSLEFLSIENVHAAAAGRLASQRYCDACMTGDYPTEVPLEISSPKN